MQESMRILWLHRMMAHARWELQGMQYSCWTGRLAAYLGALDDDGVRRQVDAPGQCRRGHQHLHGSNG